MLVSDEVEASITRKLVVWHEIVKGHDAALLRKVIRASVKSFHVSYSVLTAGDKNRNLKANKLSLTFEENEQKSFLL